MNKKLLLHVLVSKTSSCADCSLDFIVTVGTKLEHCYWKFELLKEFVCACMCIPAFCYERSECSIYQFQFTVLISVSLGFFLYFIKSLIPHLIHHLSVHIASTFLTQL